MIWSKYLLVDHIVVNKLSTNLLVQLFLNKMTNNCIEIETFSPMLQ